VEISSQTEGWQALLSEANYWYQPMAAGNPTLDFPTIGPGEGKVIVASVRQPVALPVGQIGTVEISATLSTGPTGSATVRSIVKEDPKIYFMTMDGFSSKYLALGRHGEPDPDPAELLMPNVREFLDEAAWFPRARCCLPSSTDMNMFGLFSRMRTLSQIAMESICSRSASFAG